MQIFIFTLFPEFFNSVFATSILGRALKNKLLKIQIVNLRDFATDKHHTTDDRPYGGGPGMVMKVEPINLALQEFKFKKGMAKEKIILTSAKGKVFTQQTAGDWQTLDRLALICGHYEGVDERVVKHLIDEEIRIGDYVLTGGEPAVTVMVDALTRLIPGVLGNELSNLDESHSTPGKLGHPQYTRPENYQGWRVPAELLTGDHQKITAWRKNQKS
ncbi:MAG: tRNA (guanosine(37)-N1)-methyltransferase TrmD [Candidatus Pacebacteria bacterium RIFOXYB1_FULL_39_46]|nr:MAG: tRNA (guanosine(37)-N1)-methyltransferase TrmD [Candidatus Pacebacteria bacterium RIFOXYA1_FULL_38_18]OGJ37908.1 MAG: tRNA (guanosine(37)-N1)-methyltransferase TrmD [Candidatus Pacebacteria bacterium RIFOXYB1_FULL_39_46]OGJ39507.1 MAG: tRNA (guanosine(37)-N1)-methyltransferase TrmD [Candidatus Pacebacteria bacterium RIFOXYC1_FULL_39_21]OGJ40087.1 MAG: tRNA (guanosine(37)-N1)-methyltransferase TrmD [Candidatus Pacebacteria bacterium RIFOXYD1_FULL_39_27]